MTVAPSPFYYATTTLDLRQTDKPEDYLQDIYVGDVCYRRVDPPYFAWLRHKMVSAKQEFDAGRLSKTAWDELRGRFNRLQEWALEHYGKETLRSAIRTLDPAGYCPPVNRQPKPFLFPATGDLKFTEPVAPHAVAKVNAIREAAEACNWTEARLYQNRGRFRFPLGQDYGLVCFIDPTDELGAVTPTYIEIIHHNPDGPHVVRFHNADVFPPRIQRPAAQ